MWLVYHNLRSTGEERTESPSRNRESSNFPFSTTFVLCHISKPWCCCFVAIRVGEIVVSTWRSVYPGKWWIMSTEDWWFCGIGEIHLLCHSSAAALTSRLFIPPNLFLTPLHFLCLATASPGSHKLRTTRRNDICHRKQHGPPNVEGIISC